MYKISTSLIQVGHTHLGNKLTDHTQTAWAHASQVQAGHTHIIPTEETNTQTTLICKISTSLTHAGHAHTAYACPDQVQVDKSWVSGLLKQQTLRSHPWQER